MEAAVQNVGRWVLAPLRNHRFFSLSEVREAIAPLLAALNERPFQKIEGSRRSPFEDLDRPPLKPPGAAKYADWRKARVNIDYHIQVDGCSYSVPHALDRRDVEVRLGAATVEIFHSHRRVAAHIRGRRKRGYTTDPGHMPAAHRAHLDWTPSRLVRWARMTGPDTAAFAGKLLERADPTWNRATAAASASCGSPETIPANAWRPPAVARWISVRSATRP